MLSLTDPLKVIAPALKATIPTIDSVMDSLDGESKGWTRGSEGT
jgi:hypothetical protein